jgi:hypothetical protein
MALGDLELFTFYFILISKKCQAPQKHIEEEL